MIRPVEVPAVFDCAGQTLLGIVHPAEHASSTGVVIVVGGPQYRVGSHRQFVCTARSLASAGYSVLRFDYRGMGDSEGEQRTFDSVADDIRSAVDYLAAAQGVKQIVLVGLCDAASACWIYCSSDPRVRGLILLNPWVRTQEGEARSYLQHYYLQRIFSRAFWRKAVSGELRLVKSLRELLQNLWQIRGSRQAGESRTTSFIERMYEGLATFKGETLVLISGHDLTAQEFMDWCARSERWQRAMARSGIRLEKLPNADHTLSVRAQLEAANRLCVEWLRAKWPT